MYHVKDSDVNSVILHIMLVEPQKYLSIELMHPA